MYPNVIESTHPKRLLRRYYHLYKLISAYPYVGLYDLLRYFGGFNFLGCLHFAIRQIFLCVGVIGLPLLGIRASAPATRLPPDASLGQRHGHGCSSQLADRPDERPIDQAKHRPE